MDYVQEKGSVAGGARGTKPKGKYRRASLEVGSFRDTGSVGTVRFLRDHVYRIRSFPLVRSYIRDYHQHSSILSRGPSDTVPTQWDDFARKV